MSDADQTDLDYLARDLRATLCGGRDATLLATMLRLLAQGKPVTAADLALETRRSEATIRAETESWSDVDLDEDRRIVGLCGLTLRQTRHSLELDGEQLYTWCALDTLFLPTLLARPARVRSTCPITGARVELRVSPAGIERANPADLRVSFPPLAATDRSDIVGSFCSHVFFLADRAAVSSWLDNHAGARALDTDSAFELGRRAVAPMLDADRAT